MPDQDTTVSRMITNARQGERCEGRAAGGDKTRQIINWIMEDEALELENCEVPRGARQMSDIKGRRELAEREDVQVRPGGDGFSENCGGDSRVDGEKAESVDMTTSAEGDAESGREITLEEVNRGEMEMESIEERENGMASAENVRVRAIVWRNAR